MHAANVVRASAAARSPLIRFLGKRSLPQKIDHTPRPHPAAPSQALPTSFAEYRKNAQQHGPLSRSNKPNKPSSIEPAPGEVWDRCQLPPRFWRSTISAHEIEIIESGGAAAFA